VDSGLITATSALIGSLVGLLGLFDAGVGFLIRRADKNRETGETEMVAHLRWEIRRLKRELAQARVNAIAWREQLIESDIKPLPADWTVAHDEDE
jgi:hypothetical protein